MLILWITGEGIVFYIQPRDLLLLLLLLLHLLLLLLLPLLLLLLPLLLRLLRNHKYLLLRNQHATLFSDSADVVVFRMRLRWKHRQKKQPHFCR